MRRGGFSTHCSFQCGYPGPQLLYVLQKIHLRASVVAEVLEWCRRFRNQNCFIDRFHLFILFLVPSLPLFSIVSGVKFLGLLGWGSMENIGLSLGFCYFSFKIHLFQVCWVSYLPASEVLLLLSRFLFYLALWIYSLKRKRENTFIVLLGYLESA